MSEDDRPYGQDTTRGGRRQALRIVFRALPGLLVSIIPGLLSTTPEAMAENWPKWLAFVSLVLRSMIPTMIADFIMSFWGWFMSVGLLLVVAMNIPPRLYPWRQCHTATARSRSPESTGADHAAPVAVSIPEVVPVPEAAFAPSPAAGRTDERVMIDVDLKYVRGLFEKLTSTQAEQLLADYVGKLTKRSGKVGDVLSGGKYFTRIMFESQPFTIPYTPSTRIQMDFREDKKFDRLLLLRPGDTITVLGQIQRVDSSMLCLDNCEVLEPRYS